MTKLPYFAHYSKDFLTDERVRLMTRCQVGMYVLLLDHAWINGGLPADPEQVRRILSDSKREFARDWPVVSACFPVAQDGRRRNSRQEIEREVAEQRSTKATNSARKRWKTKEEGYAMALPTHCQGNARAYESVSVSSPLSKPELQKEPLRAREPEWEIVTTAALSIIVEELKGIYLKAGVPIAVKHETALREKLRAIPEEKWYRIPEYCKWALVTGRWDSPRNTKNILRVLDDGDWDVELVARTLALPVARATTAREQASREAEERFLKEHRRGT